MKIVLVSNTSPSSDCKTGGRWLPI